MGDIDDTIFETAESGASTTYPQQCSALRKGGYVMIKNRPCKIVEMSTSKTGRPPRIRLTASHDHLHLNSLIFTCS